MDEPAEEARTAPPTAPPPHVRPTQFARSLGPAWVETAPGIFHPALPPEHALPFGPAAPTKAG